MSSEYQQIMSDEASVDEQFARADEREVRSCMLWSQLVQFVREASNDELREALEVIGIEQRFRKERKEVRS